MAFSRSSTKNRRGNDIDGLNYLVIPKEEVQGREGATELKEKKHVRRVSKENFHLERRKRGRALVLV